MEQKNTNELIIGQSGTGKTILAQTKILNFAQENPTKKIFIFDKGNGYRHFVQTIFPTHLTQIIDVNSNNINFLNLFSFNLFFNETSKTFSLGFNKNTIITEIVSVITEITSLNNFYSNLFNISGKIEEIVKKLIQQEIKQCNQDYADGIYNIQGSFHLNRNINIKEIYFDLKEMIKVLPCKYYDNKKIKPKELFKDNINRLKQKIIYSDNTNNSFNFKSDKQFYYVNIEEESLSNEMTYLIFSYFYKNNYIENKEEAYLVLDEQHYGFNSENTNRLLSEIILSSQRYKFKTLSIFQTVTDIFKEQGEACAFIVNNSQRILNSLDKITLLDIMVNKKKEERIEILNRIKCPLEYAGDFGAFSNDNGTLVLVKNNNKFEGQFFDKKILFSTILSKSSFFLIESLKAIEALVSFKRDGVLNNSVTILEHIISYISQNREMLSEFTKNTSDYNFTLRFIEEYYNPEIDINAYFFDNYKYKMINRINLSTCNEFQLKLVNALINFGEKNK